MPSIQFMQDYSDAASESRVKKRLHRHTIMLM